MCTLYNTITNLCKEKGVSGSRMCLDLGLSKSTMSDLKNGRIKGISVPTAQKISGYFGITVDELYGKEDKKEKPIVQQDTKTKTASLTAEDIELLRLFHSVPKNIQDAVIAMLKSQAPKEETYTIKIAARNGDPIKEVTITDSEYERIKNLPDVDI